MFAGADLENLPGAVEARARGANRLLARAAYEFRQALACPGNGRLRRLQILFHARSVLTHQQLSGLYLLSFRNIHFDDRLLELRQELHAFAFERAHQG